MTVRKDSDPLLFTAPSLEDPAIVIRAHSVGQGVLLELQGPNGEILNRFLGDGSLEFGTGGAPPASLADLSDVSGTPGPSKSPVGDPGGDTFTLTEVPTQADLDAILAGVSAVDWRTLQLADPRLVPFSTQDPRFADPAWRLTLNNVVHLQGMVACIPPLSNADVGLVIGTLDPDSRPLATLLFGCPALNNNARVDVNPDGTILFQGMLIGDGEIDWFSLSIITFSVGAAQ